MIAGIVLVVVISLYRLLPAFLGYTTVQPDWFINVSPMAALILCSAAMLPKRWAIALPFVALLGTDLILNAHYVLTIQGVAVGHHSMFNAEFLAKTVAFGVIASFGWMLRNHARPAVLFPAVIGGSIFFYLVTNTAAWLYDPGYLKNLSGWTQAMTTGLPTYQPTWMFYRNTFLSDLVFTALFLLCVRPVQSAERPEKVAAAAW
jgi:hypothetical protein